MSRMCLAGFLAFALAFFSANPAQGQSIYKKLATIEDQGAPAEKTVKRFRSLVPILARKYPASEKQIFNVTVGAKKAFDRESGLSMPLLDVMEGINRVTPRHGTQKAYFNILGAYSLLRVEESYSHSEAIAALAAEF